MKRKNWLTRDGRRIAPECMTCDHLRAAVAMILRKRWRMAWLGRLLDEIARRCQPKDPAPADTSRREKETT